MFDEFLQKKKLNRIYSELDSQAGHPTIFFPNKIKMHKKTWEIENDSLTRLQFSKKCHVARSATQF